MRIGYLDCFSGISGDMLLGAMVDAGVPLELLAEAAASLHVGARLEARKVIRGGITGIKVDVLTEEASSPHDQVSHSTRHSHSHHHHTHDHRSEHSHEDHHSNQSASAHTHEHRSLSNIQGIIAASSLADPVKQRAARAFRLLGEAEAAIHSIPVEQVHFHEVGAIDTIVDIVCTAAGAEHLKIGRWIASPLNVGSGTVECAHGTLPVPAPATLALLGDAPVYSAGVAMERVTPTGATILRMLDVEYGTLPAGRVKQSGYGAGGRDAAGAPNLLRLMVAETEAAGQGAESHSEPGTEQIAILECVIDDSTPQLLAYASELLLDSGAWDVYRIPVQMKKGRTGVQLTVLCAPERLGDLREILFRETTTIGAHWRIETKQALAREFVEVNTPWHPVRMKIARSATGEVLNAAPEFEDCRRIATEHHIPLKKVMQEATQAWLASEGNGQQGSGS